MGNGTKLIKSALTATALLALLMSGVEAQKSKAQSGSSQPRPQRVRAKLDGFDLTPKSGNAPARRPNQIGGASRGLGDLALYAPTMGKAYTLTPTFAWRSDDAKAEYTFKLSQPAMGADAVYEAKVTGDHLTYPADAPALKPGETYVWTVTPVIDMLGAPASASVVIVGGSERDAVTAAVTKAGDDAAARAKIYVEMRLWFDAIAAYTALIEKSPQPEWYEARAQLYDQLPATVKLADADAAKAAHK